MTENFGRDHRAYSGWVEPVAITAARSLLAADRRAFYLGDGQPLEWWQADVLSEYGNRLRVGGAFYLLDGPRAIGQYRVVAMAVAPEGYVTVVAHASPCEAPMPPTPPTGPTISLRMLVKPAATRRPCTAPQEGAAHG